MGCKDNSSNNRFLKRYYCMAIDYYKKHKIKVYLLSSLIILVILLGTIFNFFSIKKLLGFLLFIIIGGGINYVIVKYHLTFDFAPIMFFAVMTAKYIGFFWVIPYIIISEVLTFFPAGETPGPLLFVFEAWMVVLAFSSLYIGNLAAAGIALSLVHAFGRVLITAAFGMISFVSLGSIAVNLAANAYLFVKFTDFFAGMLL